MQREQNNWDNGFMCEVHLELVTSLHEKKLGPLDYYAREPRALTCPSRHRFNRHCHCYFHPFSLKMLHKSLPLPLRHCRLPVLPHLLPHLTDIPLFPGLLGKTRLGLKTPICSLSLRRGRCAGGAPETGPPTA